MADIDPHTLTCHACGNVGLVDGDDGFFYCNRCGSPLRMWSILPSMTMISSTAAVLPPAYTSPVSSSTSSPQSQSKQNQSPSMTHSRSFSATSAWRTMTTKPLLGTMPAR
ncbi:hypothetical protein S245_003577 [Arachis hypogaea]